jgi:hypothetical protein
MNFLEQFSYTCIHIEYIIFHRIIYVSKNHDQTINGSVSHGLIISIVFVRFILSVELRILILYISLYYLYFVFKRVKHLSLYISISYYMLFIIFFFFLAIHCAAPWNIITAVAISLYYTYIHIYNCYNNTELLI